MEQIFKRPRLLGLTAIFLNVIPTYWTYFFFITIPIIILGFIFLAVRPKAKLTYEIPAGLLVGGSFLGLLLTVVSLIEMSSI